MTITEPMIAEWGLRIGVPALILFMMFIIWDIARKSNAGRDGTFALFLALAVGMLGFVIKGVLTYFIEG